MDLVQNAQDNGNNNKMVSPSQYGDYVFSKYITDIFANMQRGEGSYWQNMFIFMLVCSINEIKKGLGVVYTEIGELIKDNYKNVFSAAVTKFYNYSKIIYNFRNMFIPKKIEFDNPIEAFNTTFINVQCNVQFMQSFINYLIQNKYEFDKNDDNYSYYKVKNEQIFNITDVENSNIDEIWHDIVVFVNDVKITIVNDIKMSFSKNNNTKLLTGYEISAEENDNIYDNKFYDNVENFYELIKDENIKRIIKQKFNIWTPSNKNHNENIINENNDENISNYLMDNIIEQYNIKNVSNKNIKSGLYNNSLEYILLHTMIKKMKKLKIRDTFEQICLFVYVCKFILNYDDSEILNIFGIIQYTEKDDEKVNFITFYGHKLPTSYFVKFVHIFVPATFYNASINVDYEAKNEFNILKNIEVAKIKNDCSGSKRLGNFKSSFVNKSNYLVLKITSEKNEEFIQSESAKFIENIKLNGNLITKDKKKVKIYNVSYKETIETEEIPNTEFEMYEKLMEKALQTGEKTVDENKNMTATIDASEMLKLAAARPSKTIKIEKKIKRIEKNFVKEIYKNIDTIYLRENDMKKIKTYLDNFHYNKELMTSLGLSDKLITLLYGLPGTGKTSLIYVIACFLQKDIYYVNFSKINTNKEYQDIINYVQKNCGNSIIIFEDIDATTNVVHQRSENTKDLTMNEIIDVGDDKLTLSYILNSLDGALTADGSVIIMTTNYIDKLDKAIHRPGRVDVKIEMKKCDHHQIKQMYKKFIKRDIDDDILQKISIDKYIPAEIIGQLRIYMNDYEEMTDLQIMEPFIDDNLINFNNSSLNNSSVIDYDVAQKSAQTLTCDTEIKQRSDSNIEEDKSDDSYDYNIAKNIIVEE